MASNVQPRTTLSDFAPHVPVSLPVQGMSMARSAFVQFVTDNPLWWFWHQGRRNAQADMEGPLYVIGAPDRQIEDGKAVIATSDELRKYKPYLLTVTVRTPDGKPASHAHIDFWQATSNGSYFYKSYNLRGKFKTDAQGRFELLTIAPGEYGPLGSPRAGHFHIMINGGDKYELFVTQLYVCSGNDKGPMERDFLNYFRAPRFGNMLKSWSIPASNDGQSFMEFPAAELDAEKEKRVEWWNARLAEPSSDAPLKVVAGAETELVLNNRPGWFSL